MPRHAALSCPGVATLFLVIAVTAFAANVAPAAAADFDVRAIAGKPFGVGEIKLHPAKELVGFSPLDGDFQLTEKNGRALYPAFVGSDRDGSQIIYFLFRGDEPLDVSFRVRKSYAATIEPKHDEHDRAALTQRWFDAFVNRASLRSPDEAEVSPIVDNYLAAMLARRMGFQYDPPHSRWFGGDPVNQTFALLLGAESVRTAMAKDAILNSRREAERADQPLPAPTAPPALELPAVVEPVAIEPIARHVPHECFYVRFGSFENFQWFRETLDDWGGDLRNLTAIRGVDYQTSARLERQLLLKETALGKILGPQVIADVAIVGQDTFVREGSSLGFIFQAKNNLLLSTSLGQQRAEALKRPGVSETQLKIAGHDVSFISSADNSTRSFYAVDGDFHFITNSQTLVRRFFEAGRGQDALADAHEFRYARTLMPTARDDAAFVYLSDEFFRTLVGPRYRVEMTRRMQAATDLELIRLARLSAAVERQPAESLEQLVAAKLLPPDFGVRSDGSRTVRSGDQFVDSLRGARGSFLPVADVPIERITRSEANAYLEFARAYANSWRRMDPVMIGVQHRPGGSPKHEQIALDIHIAPYAKQHYGMVAGFLAPATRSAVALVQSDIVAGQVALHSFHAFVGLRDAPLEFTIRDRRVVPGLEHGPLEGYLGAFPIMTNMDYLFFSGRNLENEGYNEQNGRWTRRIGEFGIYSTEKAVLETVGTQLRKIEAERPAQLRLHIGDISQSKLAEIVNATAYLRADQTSRGNTRFLHNLALEMGIPLAQCPAVAEDLLDGKLACPLGGKYKLHDDEQGQKKWVSTRWIPIHDDEKLAMPAGYVPPPLNWFRSLDLEFSIDDTTLNVHAELNVERR